MEAVRLLEQGHQSIDVVGLFDKTLRIPLAVGHREEVTAINMDRSGEATNRIDDGVDDVRSEGHRLALAKRLGSGGLDRTVGVACGPSPEDVVLAARVDADDRPHPMIMR